MPLLLIQHCQLYKPNVLSIFRDAEDAIRYRDGYDFEGSRLRVEYPQGKKDFGSGGSFRGGFSRGRGRGCSIFSL